MAALLLATTAYGADNSINMFGGEAYVGEPDLALTAAFLRAGGGPEGFSTAEALTTILGEDTVNAEVEKLTDQYGEDAVQAFISGTDHNVQLALGHAADAGVELPEPANLEGTELAAALVQAGVTPDGTFWAGHFYDKLVSHDIHNAVMKDVNEDPELGVEADQLVHRLTNQAFYDVAQALGQDDVKLADLH